MTEGLKTNLSQVFTLEISNHTYPVVFLDYGNIGISVTGGIGFDSERSQITGLLRFLDLEIPTSISLIEENGNLYLWEFAHRSSETLIFLREILRPHLLGVMSNPTSCPSNNSVKAKSHNCSVELNSTQDGSKIEIKFALMEKLNSIVLENQELKTAVGIQGHPPTPTQNLSEKIARDAALVILGLRDHSLQSHFLPMLEAIVENSLNHYTWNYGKEHRYG